MPLKKSIQCLGSIHKGIRAQANSLTQESVSNDQKWQMDNFLSSYPEEHPSENASKLRKVIQIPTDKVKVTTKLFEIEITEDQLDANIIELELKPKVTKKTNLFGRMSEQVSKLQKKMEFKLVQPHTITPEQLQQLKRVDSVDIVVTVPTVANSRHTGAALYLKNIKESHVANNQQLAQTTSLDRKDFLTYLQQEIKLKRQETFSEAQKNKCFKKSTLDQVDTTRLFEKEVSPAQKLVCKEEDKSKTQISNGLSKSLVSNQIKSQDKNAPSQIKYGEISSQENEESNYSRLNQKEKQKIAKKLQRIANDIDKKKAIKHRASLDILRFLEQEAEESDDGEAEREVEYDGVELDQDLVELIDNSVELRSKDENIAHRKFVEDIRLQDDRLLMRIKEGILKQRSRVESESARKRRKKRDEENKQLEREEEQWLHRPVQGKAGEGEIEQGRVEVQLAKLEQELGLEKKEKGVGKLGSLLKVEEGPKKPKRCSLNGLIGISAFQRKKKKIKLPHPVL